MLQKGGETRKMPLQEACQEMTTKMEALRTPDPAMVDKGLPEAPRLQDPGYM